MRHQKVGTYSAPAREPLEIWKPTSGTTNLHFRRTWVHVENELEIGRTGAKGTNLEAQASNRLGEGEGKPGQADLC